MEKASLIIMGRIMIMGIREIASMELCRAWMKEIKIMKVLKIYRLIMGFRVIRNLILTFFKKKNHEDDYFVNFFFFCLKKKKKK